MPISDGVCFSGPLQEVILNIDEKFIQDASDEAKVMVECFGVGSAGAVAGEGFRLEYDVKKEDFNEDEQD